jgi:hypothetical protein
VVTDVDEIVKWRWMSANGHERPRGQQGKGKDLQGLELYTPLTKQAGGNVSGHHPSEARTIARWEAGLCSRAAW